MSADGGPPIRLPLAGKTIRAADLFCGAGGTSTGARRAITQMGGKMKLVAVNHWQTAIDTHTRMHPDAEHLCADLEHVRPRQAVPGGVLDLLMASPTCTYYSRARGGRPVNDQQRMDPWHVVRWCTELRVHRLLVENVPEMMDWGPCDVRTGKPIASRKGEYFQAWIDALKAIGFRLDHRVLCCADYGDPTTRERFFLIARSDRKPLRWPEPTHARTAGTDLLSTRAKWRGAVEIIDWSRQGKSIFNRKKPLKPNTIRRILAGAVRYRWPQPYVDALQALLDGRVPVLDVRAEHAAPFLTTLRGTADAAARSVTDPKDPVPTLTAGGTHVGLVMATGAGGVARDLEQPVPTVTGGGEGGARPHFVTPLVLGTGNHSPARGIEQPMPTITTGGAGSEKRRGNARPAAVEPFVFRANQGDGRTRSARVVSEPLPTQTCSESMAVAQPILVSKHGGPGNNARAASDPMFTVDTGGAGSVAQPLVAPYYGGGSGLTAQPAEQPLPAVTTKARFGVADPVLLPVTHGGGESRVQSLDDPMPTVTGANRGEYGVAEPFVMRAGHGGDALKNPGAHVMKPGAPLPSQTGGGEFSVAQPVITQTSYSDPKPRSVDEPLRTITTAKGGDFGLSAPFLVPNFGEREGQEPRTHDVEEPVPTITASGHIQLAQPAAAGYRIDILYRMLHWRELAGAMSFDDEGEIYDFAGTATDITKQIGNAVPGRTAKALVRALLEPGL